MSLLYAVPYYRNTLVSKIPKEAYNPDCMPGSNSELRGKFRDGLGSNIMVQYSVCPIITLHDWNTAREYVERLGNQVHPMIKTLFPNNDAVFQDDNSNCSVMV
jgi:hypothetical protein